MPKCETTREQQTKALSAHEIAYELDIQSALGRVIGHPKSYMPYHESKNKRLLDIATLHHDKLYKRLYNHLLDSGKETMFLANPIDKMESLEEYIASYLGIFPTKETIFADPRRAVAVSKELNRVLDRAEKTKDISKWEKAFAPLILFGWKNDKFGILSKYLKSAATLTENYRTTASPFEARSAKVAADLNKHIDDIVSQKTVNMELPQSMTVGGFQVNTVEDDELGSKKKVHYVGTVRNKEGQPKHLIRNEDGTFSLIDKEKISNENISSGIKRRYTDIADDLMNGQTRRIRWLDKIEKDDEEKVLHILKESRVRAENQENNPYIHTLDVGNTEYRYVMVKTDEVKSSKTEEEYRAYIISHKKGDEKRVYYYAASAPAAKNKKLSKNQQYYFTWKNAKLIKKKVSNRHLVGNIPAMQNGYWTASKYLALGSKYNKNGFRMKDSNDGQFAGFKYMENQPDENIMATYETVGSKTVQSGVWQYILDKRENYRNVADVMRRLISYESSLYDKSLKRFQTAMRKRFDDPEDRNALIEKVVGFTQMNNRVAYDEETGAIITPNGYFKGISENYAPRRYSTGVLINMLSDEIGKMNLKLKEKEYTADEEKSLKEDRNDLMNAYESLTDKNNHVDDDTIVEASRLTFGQRAAMTKHRSKWTNPMLRRKDSSVDSDYFDSTFRALHANILLANMFNTISKLAAISEINPKHDFFGSGHIDYIINATKNVLGDPTAENAFKSIDKAEEWIGFIIDNDKDVVHNRETAIRMAKTVKAHMSGILLRSGGAMYNRTQQINGVIHFSYRHLSDAFNALEGDEGEKWKAIAQHYGVTESINAFADLVGPTVGFDIKNAGYIMSPKIGFLGLFPALPTMTMVDFMKMKKWEFVTKGDKYIDRALNSIRHRKKMEKRLGKLFKREERRLHGEGEHRKLEDLREAFYDLMHLPEEGKVNKEMMQKRIHRLMGDVSEQRLKKIVGWTLSAWMYGAGKKLFTFTEGERFMRTTDVVMALKMAGEQGLLGTTSKDTESLEYIDEHGNARLIHGIDKRYLTPRAIRIARSVVHTNEFLMNREAMGLAFAGIGDSIFQYKQYPLQQTLHDFNILRSFHKGSNYFGEGLVRMSSETIRMLIESTAGKGKSYDVTSANVDHQARAMIRFLLTRSMASVIGTASEYIPFVRTLTYKAGGAFFMNTLKGGENPILHIATRSLALMLAFGVFSGDDDDQLRRGTEMLLWSFARILLPVWISMPAFYVVRGVEEWLVD